MNVNLYKSHVDVADSVVHRSWSDYLKLASSSAAVDAARADELSLRYVDLTWSEAVWHELDRAHRSLGSARIN